MYWGKGMPSCNKICRKSEVSANYMIFKQVATILLSNIMPNIPTSYTVTTSSVGTNGKT
jgi:Na+/H+ antiporter NhaD/arsenite permease-like protein